MKNTNKTKEKKKKGGKVKIILLIILIILLAVVGVFAYKVHKNGGGAQGMIATMLGHDEHTVEKLPKMYCLLIGESDHLRDTIILASYDPKTQEAAMLSIPRDTFIGTNEKTATTYDKINASGRKIDTLLERVQILTGIDVRYYVLVDTKALRALVDVIGGVTFDVPVNMNYDDNGQGLHIHLKAGVQKLDGDKAEQVVRFRHNNNGTTYPASYGTQDIGRMKTQRAFLKAVAKQVLVPANVTKIPEFIDIAKSYVQTNLDFDAIKDYVPYAVNFDADNIKADKLPGTARYANTYSFYFVDKEKTEEMVNELFFSQKVEDDTQTDGNTISNTTIGENTETNTSVGTETNRSDINIEVLNGSRKWYKFIRSSSRLKSSWIYCK